MIALRLAGLQLPSRSPDLLIVVVFPFCVGVAGVILRIESSGLPTRWQLVVAPLIGVAQLCVYSPDRGWFRIRP